MLAYFLIFILVILSYIYLKKPLTYWKNKKVPQLSPWQTIYNLYKIFNGKNAIVDVMKENYERFYDKRYVGNYEFSRHTLSIHDPDLIKDITIKHFDHFSDHNSFFSDDYEPLFNSNLFSLKGQKWKKMRALLSPAFTGSKMKTMYVLVENTARQLSQHFLDIKKDIIEIEMKDIATRYANDVIANAAFGIECNSLKDRENDFYMMGKGLTDPSSVIQKIKIILFMIFPKIFKIFKIRIFPHTLINFFTKIVEENIRTREEKGIVRPDMINLLLEARQCAENEFITNQDITAQAMIFFFAGFDTVATLIGFMAHEITVNPDIQKRLQQEIDSVSKNEITYDTLLNMKFLDMVVNESLRKWPNALAMDRYCTKDFTIPAKEPEEVDVLIEEGTGLSVPLYALHRDAKYYPNPDKFDPERFSDEKKDEIKPFTYLPFGQGPRICIGNRFALMEIKAFFYFVLSDYNLVKVDKTQEPLKLSTGIFALRPQGGFCMGLERRKQ